MRVPPLLKAFVFGPWVAAIALAPVCPWPLALIAVYTTVKLSSEGLP